MEWPAAIAAGHRHGWRRSGARYADFREQTLLEAGPCGNERDHGRAKVTARGPFRGGARQGLAVSPPAYLRSATIEEDELNRPTSYDLHIRPLFRPIDIEHMEGFGVDLGTYDGVKASAPDILDRLRDATHPMPPKQADGPWPDEWIALFERWTTEGCPA